MSLFTIARVNILLEKFMERGETMERRASKAF